MARADTESIPRLLLNENSSSWSFLIGGKKKGMSAFEVEVGWGETPTVDRVSGGVGPKEERRKGEKDNSGRKKSTRGRKKL